MNNKNIIAVITIALGLTTFAESYVWSGGTSGSWSDAGNWTPSTGYPKGDDMATIVDATVSLQEAISVQCLNLGGNVTLVGEPVTVTGTVPSNFRTASGGTYTFNNKLTLSNGGYEGQSSWYPCYYIEGTIYFNGGLDATAPERLTIESGPEIHFAQVPIEFSRLCVVKATLHFDVAGNKFSRIELSGDQAIAHVNVDDPWLDFSWNEYFFMENGARLLLHGHRASVYPAAVLGQAVYSTSECFIETEPDKPATFVVNAQQTPGDLIRVNQYLDIKGPVTFTLAAASTQTLQWNRPVEMSGDLNVEGGTLELMSAAALPNIGTLRISSAGKLKLADEIRQPVAALKLDGSDTGVESGVYGATGSGAVTPDDGHFAGMGSVLVRSMSEEGVTRTLVKDANFSDATAWDPVGVPGPNDVLSVSDKTLSFDYQIPVKGIMLDGDVTFSGKPVIVTGTVPSNFRTASGGTYTFNNKLTLSNGGYEGQSSWYPCYYIEGTIYFNGGLDATAPERLTIESGPEIHFAQVPIAFSRLCVVKATLHFDVAGNNLSRIELTGDQAIAHVNVDDPWLDFSWNEYFFMENGARLLLHGHRASVYPAAILGQAVYSTSECFIETESDKPATFVVNAQQTPGDLIRVNQYLDIKGPVTFTLAAASTQTLQWNRPVEMSGDLNVEGGTLELMSDATLPNVGTVRVTGAGKLVLDKRVLDRRCTLVVDGLCNLDVAAGVTQPVAAFYVAGKRQDSGVYTCGAGQIRVGGGLCVILK